MAEVTSLKAGSRDLTSLNEEELRVALLHRMVIIRSELQKWGSTYAKVVHGSSTDVFRGQGKALALLAEQGEMLQRDMCRALGIRPQSLGEVLSKLERAGYVTREKSEKDHRALVVRITQSGKDLIENSKPDLLFTSFDKDELTQFISLIDRAVDEIEQRRRALAGEEYDESE